MCRQQDSFDLDCIVLDTIKKTPLVAFPYGFIFFSHTVSKRTEHKEAALPSLRLVRKVNPSVIGLIASHDIWTRSIKPYLLLLQKQGK
jgi:hypothetical protein